MNLLTDEEIKNELQLACEYLDTWADDKYHEQKCLCKAQAVKLIKWLDEQCTEHPLHGVRCYEGTPPYQFDTNNQIVLEVEKFTGYCYPQHRKDCPECWNKLKQEVGL